MTPENFYICVYLHQGEPIGHMGRFDNLFPDTMEKGLAEDKIPKVKRSGMKEISEQFVSTAMGCLDFVPIIMSLAPAVSHRMVQEALQKFLEKSWLSSERSPDKIVYRFNLDSAATVKRFEENLAAAVSTSRALPRMLIVGLVTALEYNLSLIMKEVSAKYPESVFGKDKTIPVQDAIGFNSIEELKEAVVNDVIDKIQRDSLDSQVKWIINKTNMDDFTKSYAEWPNLIELFERRNLFVHANGIVNEHYLRAQRVYKFSSKERSLGDELQAGPKYYGASVRRVIEFGTMLLQVVWRKLSPDDNDLADKAVGNLGYELIARGEYLLAARILEFARNLRNVSDEAFKRRTVINLANAYKLAGKETKCQETLDSMDWSAVSLAYKVCVSAVRDDVDDVIAGMRRIGTSGEVTPQDYREWPVFFGIRGNQRFIDEFQKQFGHEYVPSATKQAGLAQVMEWVEKQELSDTSKGEANIVATINHRQDTPPGTELS